MSSFSLYILGYVIFLAGLAYAATLLGIPPVWIGVALVIFAGLGIIAAVSNTRKKDETEASS